MIGFFSLNVVLLNSIFNIWALWRQIKNKIHSHDVSQIYLMELKNDSVNSIGRFVNMDLMYWHTYELHTNTQQMSNARHQKPNGLQIILTNCHWIYRTIIELMLAIMTTQWRKRPTITIEHVQMIKVAKMINRLSIEHKHFSQNIVHSISFCSNAELIEATRKLHFQFYVLVNSNAILHYAEHTHTTDVSVCRAILILSLMWCFWYVCISNANRFHWLVPNLCSRT